MNEPITAYKIVNVTGVPGSEDYNIAGSATWRCHSCHGLDGWDAGHWPLVVFGSTYDALSSGEWAYVELSPCGAGVPGEPSRRRREASGAGTGRESGGLPSEVWIVLATALPPRRPHDFGGVDRKGTT